MPRDWADDSERRAAAGIPGDLEFATKPALATGIVKDLLAERRCPPWVTGDEVYGRDAKLRQALEDSRTGYVLKIPCSFRITLPTGQKIRADHAAALVPATAWQTASAGHRSKGERDYRWAWLATTSARRHLLIRRRLTGPANRAYFWCHVPAGRPCSFTTLIRVAGRRWPVEEDFRLGKSDFGLADSQVRRYTALTRHLALAMAALAVCAVTAALARPRTSALARAPTSPDDLPPADPGLIPLTVTEIKQLFNLLTRTWHTNHHYLHWSWWRRRHQARARWVPPASPPAQTRSRSMIKLRSTAALLGKAYCKVDATAAPIEVGSLLTTSDTPGHAMRATEQSRLAGALIGKALQSLRDGRGLIPILIALQ